MAIELGIHKINFYTGMSQAALSAVEQRMANRQPLYDEFAELLLGIEEAITDSILPAAMIPLRSIMPAPRCQRCASVRRPYR